MNKVKYYLEETLYYIAACLAYLFFVLWLVYDTISTAFSNAFYKLKRKFKQNKI